MKLKNNALQELYDAVVNGTIAISPHAESSIDKAFRECDEKLQKDIDILKRSNEVLLSANLDLASNKRKFEKEIEELQKHIDIKNHLENEFRKLKEHVLEDHKIITNVSSERDALEKERDDLLIRVHCAEDEVEELKKDLVDTKIKLKFSKASNDDWKRRFNNAEKKIEELKATLEKANADRKALQENLDYYMDIYSKVQKDFDELSEDNKKMKARNDCLRLEVNWYRKHYKELSDKIQDLKSRLNSMYGDEYIKKLQDIVDNIGYEQGQTDLWDMLQNVRDVKPEEFDPECETLGDILDMDLENFLDAYKKWQKQKETDRMRNWLADFCDGRWCKECPLESDEFKCGNGYTFRGTNPIPDKDIKGYYEKARGCGGYTLKNVTYYFDNKPVTMTEEVKNVNRTISKACENFCKAVRDADIKITENLRKGCTFEATVEVNKDLLEKVCGVKPDDK